MVHETYTAVYMSRSHIISYYKDAGRNEYVRAQWAALAPACFLILIHSLSIIEVKMKDDEW